jgi:hypothetical protein
MVYWRGGGGKYVGRWLPDEKGPGADGDQRPGLDNPELGPPCSSESLLFGEGFLGSPRTGELGRLLYGDAGKDDPVVGVSVKRKSFAESCQNVLLDVNISDQPFGVFSSGSTPTAESSDEISPILSSFCIKFLPRNTPSRLIFIRQSPLGFPAAGVLFEDSFVMYGNGSFK